MIPLSSSFTRFRKRAVSHSRERGNHCATRKFNSLKAVKPVHTSEPLALLLTIDVGGSHVSAALCALDSLRVIQLTEAPLGGVSSFEGFIDLLYLLGREIGHSSR